MTTEAYKGHRAGSNKSLVHKVFDEKGKDAALKKASALGLADSTARTWCSQWARDGKKGKSSKGPTTAKKAAAKPAAKPAAKKPAAKKSAAPKKTRVRTESPAAAAAA